jgi:hypothetical protein
MEDDIKQEEQGGEESDRLRALLALALTKEKPKGRHVSPENLVAWREGRLKSDEHEAIQEHLSQCEECYTSWMELIDLGEPEPAAFGDLVQMKLHRFRCWFKEHSWGISLSGGGLAAAFIVLMLFLIPPKPIKERIDSGYNEFFGSVPRSQISQYWPYTSRRGPQRGRPQPQKLFGPDQSAERIAFLAGVRAGLEEAQTKSAPYWDDIIATLPQGAGDCPKGLSGDACKNVQERLKEAGKWAVLLHLACETEHPAAISAAFWNAQQETLTQLSGQINRLNVSGSLRTFFLNWSGKASKAQDAKKGVCSEEIGSLFRDELVE